MTPRAGQRPAAQHFDALVISCEHASRAVPRRWSAWLPASQVVRAGHRAVDFGAARMARRLGRALRAPVLLADATRLLVDCNRSPDHPGLWSEWSRRMPAEERETVLARHYHPYRKAVAARVTRHLQRRRRVLHLSVHSFTPRLNGRTRAVDVGLLYDPHRVRERHLARAWQRTLSEALPGLAVRANQPYRGWTDGLTTTLRQRLPAAAYMGIELEINQRHFGGAAWETIEDAVAETLRALRRAHPSAGR